MKHNLFCGLGFIVGVVICGISLAILFNGGPIDVGITGDGESLKLLRDLASIMGVVIGFGIALMSLYISFEGPTENHGGDNFLHPWQVYDIIDDESSKK